MTGTIRTAASTPPAASDLIDALTDDAREVPRSAISSVAPTGTMNVARKIP